MAAEVVTVDSDEVLQSDELGDWENDLAQSGLLSEDAIQKKYASVQAWVLAQLRAHGWTEADVSDTSELRNLCACRWLYEYYRDQETHGSAQEGFKSKADRWRKDCEDELKLLFIDGGLTAATSADPQGVPSKFFLLQVGQ